MRFAVGGSLIADGVSYFLDRHNEFPAASLIVVIVAMIGALLLIGYLTPLAGMLAALSGIGRMSPRLPVVGGSLFDSHLAIAFQITIAIALAFLGPGAFSLDARLFGRREIVIPRAPLPPG